MSISEFNNDYLINLLEKINLENKNVVLIGDYNINLLDYDISVDNSQFLNSMCSYSLFPTITQPTRITPKSRTLIDNIFINFHSPEVISGNITVSISDHLAQFISVPNLTKSNKPEKVHKRCYKKFDKDNFVEDISSVDWNKHIDEENVNDSIAIFLKLFDSVLDKHAPFKLMTNKEMKLRDKPWITSGILKSIKIKDSTHKKYIKAKNAETKYNLFLKFKSYRNSVSNLLKLSKKNYYTEYFNSNINNIKGTWKGIKEIINLKSSKKLQPSNLSVNNKLITDKSSVANAFNDFFSTIATKLSQKVVPTNVTFDAYLNNPNQNSFFVQPTNKKEVAGLINLLNSEKSNGPNSIPTDIIKLISNVISHLLAKIINQSFNNGVFLDHLKVANVIPVFNKGSKIDVSNYRPISLLSNIGKILERLMHSRL